MGLTSFIMFGVNALAFWFGGLMIAHDQMTAPDVLKVFVGVLLGGFAIGQASPNVSKLVAGKAVGATIFAVIDKQPAIRSDVGEKLADVTGAIDLVHVSFRYPARPDVLVFDDFSLSIAPGQMVALVGESGSGKSTIVQLIERFYDPEAGSIMVDGRDIRTLNLKWLRQHIGLVSQEPVLFGGSIRSNIMYGKEDASAEEVEAAARAANAHNFIVQLPDGYDTQVGERGVKLSGGQKQRVAIARAMLMKPKILLLDEATSALDSESERLVQEALDRMMVGRTTVVIAHRLSTIRHADVIAVMRRGKVVESGSHDELMAAPGDSVGESGSGVYRELIKLQCMPTVAGASEGGGAQGDVSHDTQLRGSSGHDDAVSSLGAILCQDGAGLAAMGHHEAQQCDSTDMGEGAVDSIGSAHQVDAGTVLGSGGPRMSGDGKARFATLAGSGDADSLATLELPDREGRHSEGKGTGKVADSVDMIDTEGRTEDGKSSDHKFKKEPLGHLVRLKRAVRRRTGKGADISGDAKPKDDASASIPKVSLARIFSYSHADWPYAVLGVIGAAVAGGVNPAWGFFFAELVAALFVTDASMLGEVRKWSYVFLGLAALCLVANMATVWPLGMVDANLIYRLRRRAMSAILRQDMAFFDDEANTSGALAGRIENDTQAVRALAGDRMGIVIINLVSTLVGFVGALVVGWKLALVTLSIFPLMVASETIQGKFLSGVTAAGAQDLMGPANQIMSESVANIRTVAAFTAEDKVLRLYERHLARPFKAGFRRGQVAGASYGASNFIFFCSYALCFWYGGQLIDRGEMTFDEVLKTFFLIVFGAMAIGQNQARGGDIKKAREAANRIFYLLDLPPRFSRDDPKGVTRDSPLQGAIELRHVSFAYPRRPGSLIFDDFSLDVPAGQMVALVGESGSGKSTVVGLIERFYDPVSGVVMIDGVDIRDYNLKWLRQHIGLVSQEPVLFGGSIRSNIMYGKEDASAEEVEAAARAANAHNFIAQLPDGYNTDVGERGTQLSGGQKQRIAIARAILKDPRILLLDEATSALDSESERLVQEALDRMMVGRTTVVIAHRLSTIRHAHMIAVVQKGKIVETGTHRELLVRGGAYAALAKARGDWRSDTLARGDSTLTRSESTLGRGESTLGRDEHSISTRGDLTLGQMEDSVASGRGPSERGGLGKQGAAGSVPGDAVARGSDSGLRHVGGMNCKEMNGTGTGTGTGIGTGSASLREIAEGDVRSPGSGLVSHP
eukprot:jgi/Mesvir1/22438/Mv17911-RA.2